MSNNYWEHNKHQNSLAIFEEWALCFSVPGVRKKKHMKKSAMFDGFNI